MTRDRGARGSDNDRATRWKSDDRGDSARSARPVRGGVGRGTAPAIRKRGGFARDRDVFESVRGDDDAGFAPGDADEDALDPRDWIFGRRAVLEALRAERPIHKIWIAEGTHGTLALVEQAREAGISVQRSPRSFLDRLSQGGRHQGVAAAVAAHDFVSLEEILERAGVRASTAESNVPATGTTQPGFLVVLDGVQDPQNLGAILRTAAAVGCHGVVIGRHRSAGLTPTVVRASAGAVEHIPVARVPGIPAALQTLRESGVWIVGLDPEGQTDFRTVDFRQPVAIVIGGEGKGMGRLTAERCDQRVRLPMTDRIGSFNASVAAALCLYQVYSSRNPI
ncbi:MAG: 23S rRNA (guanosine(2251)-2'-O)-methyltransferase RlmB [Candidatus Eisenbacteria bacterium]